MTEDQNEVAALRAEVAAIYAAGGEAAKSFVAAAKSAARGRR